MVKAPPVPSSLTGTFFVFGGAALDFLLLPVELFGTSSTGTQHSKEALLPEWVQEALSGPEALPGNFVCTCARSRHPSGG